MQKVITDDLDALLGIFPPHIQTPLNQQEDVHELVEVIMDLGRTAEARFPDREIPLGQTEVTQADIDYVSTRIGNFGEDNRAGIERTLHRISAIRNRQGKIVGLTCRVGRAITGTIKVIEDLITSGKSVMLLGRPGVGKTTMLREIARVLADEFNKRVIIVDTSNEIAGDGDIPHPAIGHARRMQVTSPVNQHAVMIEAVENHMPEVIVIDEMGTELEALAARTIAERGVQLVGTAHGNTLENLILNPTLSDLIGGIQSVTLGDEEAKRRGTQKSILERTSPPTFDIVVEIQDRDRVAIHPDVAEAVDATLRGQAAPTEVRWLDDQGEIAVEKIVPQVETKTKTTKARPQVKEGKVQRLYLFGVNRGKFEETAKNLLANVEIVENIKNADLFVTSKRYYRRKPQKVKDAELSNLPIYVLRTNTPGQIRQFLYTISPSSRNADIAENQDSLTEALKEAHEAINLVKNGDEDVELSPQGAYIRRLQHLIAERNEILSTSFGKDPKRRVRFYKG
ncbi:MAG: AAA family ATPase [Dehalococcoidales bacterium]|nr:AAA family ATPase [Dehalococcoidales bacterium]